MWETKYFSQKVRVFGLGIKTKPSPCCIEKIQSIKVFRKIESKITEKRYTVGKPKKVGVALLRSDR